MRTRAAVGAIAMVVLAAAGCSSSTDDAKLVVPQPTTTQKSTGGSCDDPVGDIGFDSSTAGHSAEPSGIDIVHAEASVIDDSLHVTFQTAGPIAAAPQPTFFMDQGPYARTASFEIRAKPGADPTQPWPLALYTWEATTTGIRERSPRPLTTTATVTGNTLSYAVPLGEIPPVATLIWLFGTTSGSGENDAIDDCNSMNTTGTLPPAPDGNDTGTTAPPESLPPLKLEQSREHESGALVTVFEVHSPPVQATAQVPDEGMQLAVVRAQVCAGKSVATVASFNFGLTIHPPATGTDGADRNLGVAVGNTPQQGSTPVFPGSSTSLDPGACAVGWITFQMPIGSEILEVFFSRNVAGDDALIWKLN